MNELSIDPDRMIKFELGPLAYIMLKALNESRYDIIREWLSHDQETVRMKLKSLQLNLYIRTTKEDINKDDDLKDVIDVRKKGEDLFNSQKGINFDEFFDVFPFKTVDGRMLKVKVKELNGKYTEGYKKSKSIYLRKVRSQKDHELAVLTVKARALSDDTKYMNNIDTYIRNKMWEKDYFKYVESDESPDWDKNVANE